MACAGPPAGVVPALPGAATRPVGSGGAGGDYPPTRPPAVAAAQRLPPADRLPVDRGPTRTTAAAAPAAPPTRPDPPIPRRSPLGSDRLDRAHCTGRTPFGREGLGGGGTGHAAGVRCDLRSRRGRPRPSLRPPAGQPQHPAAAPDRRCRPADGCAGEPRSDRGDDRQHGRHHCVVGGTPRPGIPVAWARRSSAGVDAVGRLHDTSGEPRVGSGVRQRTGPYREVASSAPRPDHSVVDCLDLLSPGLRMGNLDERGHRTSVRGRQHRDRDPGLPRRADGAAVAVAGRQRLHQPAGPAEQPDASVGRGCRAGTIRHRCRAGTIRHRCRAGTIRHRCRAGTIRHRCRAGTRRRSTGDGWADPIPRVGIGKCRCC